MTNQVFGKLLLPLKDYYKEVCDDGGTDTLSTAELMFYFLVLIIVLF